MSNEQLILSQLMEIKESLGEGRNQMEGLHEKIDEAKIVAKQNSQQIQELTGKFEAINYASLEEKKENFVFVRELIDEKKTKAQMKKQIESIGITKFATLGFKTLIAGLSIAGLAIWQTIKHFVGIE